MKEYIVKSSDETATDPVFHIKFYGKSAQYISVWNAVGSYSSAHDEEINERKIVSKVVIR